MSAHEIFTIFAVVKSIAKKINIDVINRLRKVCEQEAFYFKSKAGQKCEVLMS